MAANQIYTLILSSAFPALYVYSIGPDTGLPVWFKSVFALLSLLCAGYFLYTIVKVARILATKGSWRAVIENGRLNWVTAIPYNPFPIDVALNDINQVVRLETFVNSMDNDTSVILSFEIQFSDGTTTSISSEDSGLNPHLVFMALKEHGIGYHQYKLDKTDDEDNVTRVIEKTL